MYWLWHMTDIMSDGFHACDSPEQMTYVMGSDWLMVCCAVTHMTYLMDVKLWFTMSHRGCVTRGDESPGLRLREDSYISGLVATNRWARIISTPPPPIEISTPREITVTFPHPPLFSHEGYYLEVDVKPPALLFWGLSASPPWGSCSLSSLTRSWSRILPLTWHLLCTSGSILLGLKASRCIHGRRSGVRLSVEVGLSLLGLYLWWGKSRAVTSRSPLGCVVIPTALSMACFSFVASPVRHPSFLHLLSLSACTITATGAGTLLPHDSPWSSVPSSVTPSRGIALPQCLVSNPLDQCNYRPIHMDIFAGPQVQ